MNTKRQILIILSALFFFVSCGDDFLSSSPTDKQEADTPNTEQVIMAKLTAAYQALLFDAFANVNHGILLMSDMRSDDIFKGGSDAGDQAQLYRLSQLNATPTEIPKGLWDVCFAGLSRSNSVLIACDNPLNMDDERLKEIRSEAHFLRAYYLHCLWKFWGNIPYFEEALEAPYMVKQYKADEIYELILENIEYVLSADKLPMKNNAENKARANKAAAMMLKARVVMYQKDETKYQEVLDDMAAIIASGEYELMDDYAEIWLDEGEFCKESVFEINHVEEGKTWDNGWQGFGTSLPIYISPSDLKGFPPLKGGWGFGTVRPDLYQLFENDDLRRDISIHHFPKGSYTARFQDTGYFQGKYAAREGYTKNSGDVDLNYKNNLRIFRYAETLLNAAELIVFHNLNAHTGISAEFCLDQIRNRAGLSSIAATVENIKLERRKEFVGEGMRFWDIVRWDDTHLLTENIPEYFSVRTWSDYKKLLPIPQSDIDKTQGEYKLQQNEGY